MKIMCLRFQKGYYYDNRDIVWDNHGMGLGDSGWGCLISDE